MKGYRTSNNGEKIAPSHSKPPQTGLRDGVCLNAAVGDKSVGLHRFPDYEFTT
jgi:hypothetical protein